MARKLLRCSKVNPGGLSFCMFSKLQKEKGYGGFERITAPEYNCMLCKGDTYNIFPATSRDADNDLAWHQFEHPDRSEEPGTRMYQYEALTPHNTTGDELLPLGKYRSQWFAEEHPCYSLIDFNVPINRYGGLSEDEPVTVAGKGTFLVSDRWVEDKFGEPKKAIGRKRVEECYGIYGAYDSRKGRTIHRSMKDYSNDIPGWINYTTIRRNPKPKLYNIHISSMEEIESFVNEELEDSVSTSRLMRAYEILRNNNPIGSSVHIDIKRLLLNNGVPLDKVIRILSVISTRDPQYPFKSTTGKRTNLQKLRDLYLAIRPKRMNINQKQKGYEGILKMNWLEARTYMANIVNCILNDPVLKDIDIQIDNIRNVSVYRTPGTHSSKQYWYAMEIIELAYYDNIVNNTTLPKWIRTLFKEHLKYKEEFKHVANNNFKSEDFIVHKDGKTYVDDPNGVYGDWLDTIILGLTEPYQLYPAMMTIREVLQPSLSEEYAFLTFRDMCRVIKKCTIRELKIAWIYFMTAWNKNDPSMWWQFINDIITTNKFDNITSQNSKENGFNFATDLWNAGIEEDSWNINIDEHESLQWDINTNNNSVIFEDEESIPMALVNEDIRDEIDPEIDNYSKQGMSNLGSYNEDIDYDILHAPSIDHIQNKIDHNKIDKMGE